MKAATADAAEASKQSAKAAEASLHINRPFLLVTGMSMMPPARPDDKLHVINVIVENFGTGPADVRDYVALADLLDSPNDEPFSESDPPVSHPPDEGEHLQDPLIRVGETAKERIHVVVELGAEERKQMVCGEKKIAS